ncbi:MAG TPA: ATP-binding protein [Thermoanaerobaculia bacterium]|jgi:signal transduction histidine kinase/HAMP domain-containing protein|nr:ATP-binding protein [Thermoanaerobaculia bacterium]
MRRTRLSTLLIGVNAALVLLAVVCVLFASMGLLRRLADEQALAHVDLAGKAALEAVERSAEDVRTSARLLGERPTVGRLLQARDAAGLDAFLERFRVTSHLTGCAVFVGGQRFAHAGTLDGRLTATVPVTFYPGATATVALALDATFVAGVSRQVGLPVAIVSVQDAQARTEDPRYLLRDQVLSSGRPASGRLDEAGAYVSILPVAGGLVETSLPTEPIASSLGDLVHTLLYLSLWVALLATAAGWLISRRLARPVQALTAAAARIGRGDLSTPTPRAPGAELGTLSATMEETRLRLLRLTSELRRRQAEGEAILTGIAEGVFSVDRDRRVRYLNPQAAALLGIRPEDAIGRFCGDVLNAVLPDGSRPCFEHCPILHARFRGATRATENLLLADGSRRAVVVTSSPAVEDHQFQVMRDETDVEAARRLRDSVLANISHEFRTPLSAQLASLELLLDRIQKQGSDPETEALVLSLERGTLRLTQLIDNLLESVRIEAGQDSIRRRPVALDEVVENAVEMTSPLMVQRGQRIRVDLPYPLPVLEGDAPRLTQVFVNLLANANKYAPAGSEIRIGGKLNGSAVHLWVEDEGPGLPGEGALFDPFVRGGATEPEQSGVGLGLWIVQSIVERHGGTVEARREGAGTRMYVILPLSSPGEPS